MNLRRDMEKYIRPSAALGIVIIVLIALTVICAALGATNYARGSNQQPTPFLAKGSKSGDYVTIDIIGVSDWVYEYDDETYYIAIDEQYIPFALRLTDTKFASLRALNDYWNDDNVYAKPPAPVTITGMVRTTRTEIREFINSQIARNWQNMSYDDHGDIYINTTTTPAEDSSMLWFVLAVATLTFAVILGVTYIVTNKRANECIDALRRQDKLDSAADQFAADDTIQTGGDTMRMSADYIYSKAAGVVLAYEDILWCYRKTINRGLLTSNDILYANTRTHKHLPLTRTTGIRNALKSQAMLTAIDIIQARHPEAMIGYSKDNARAYKQMYTGK